MQAVLLLDSDLLPSRQFGEEVGSSRGWAALRQQLDLVPAVVLPAFQPTNSTLGQQGTDSDRGSGGEKEAGGTGQRQALQAADGELLPRCIGAAEREWHRPKQDWQQRCPSGPPFPARRKQISGRQWVL